MATESSVATYGHTGFTGTCFWIDPEEELVYIFLSNRVHPKVNNRIYQYGIRKSIHNTAYDSRMFE
jgi:CubicO group peptidase (beta-lactamase class C family)